MSGEQKSELEQWFEHRSVRLEWQDPGRTRAIPKIIGRRRSGRADQPQDAGLPGFVMTELPGSVRGHRRESGGDCFFWLPRGWTGRQTLCIASSRIGRHPGQFPWWTAALRTACLTAAHDGFAMLTGEGMTAAPYVRRLAQLLDSELVDFRLAPRNPNLAWFRRIARLEESDTTYPVWVFPTPNELPGGGMDSIALGVSDWVRVIGVSDGGNVSRAVQQRLLSTGNDGSVWLLADGHAVSDSLKKALTGQGAIEWLLHNTGPTDEKKRNADILPPAFRDLIVDLPADADRFLAHWTRARGRHPGIGSEQERLDRILFDTGGGSGDPLETLLSIVCSRRLLAGSALTRDSTPMISFTEVPLAEFPDRRVFRQHLGRWDFESFGIAIRKTALLEMGARPVIYGDDAIWNSLDAAGRPYFQLNRSADSPAMNWELEREWRMAGDLDLARIESVDLLVFVPDRDAAEKVAGFSRWPVAILPSKKSAI